MNKEEFINQMIKFGNEILDKEKLEKEKEKLEKEKEKEKDKDKEIIT